jgi:hypothetical protein
MFTALATGVVPPKWQPAAVASGFTPRSVRGVALARNRKFESISLQRGVRCELDPTASAGAVEVIDRGTNQAKP